MNAETLKDFLISLGFNVDEAGANDGSTDDDDEDKRDDRVLKEVKSIHAGFSPFLWQIN